MKIYTVKSNARRDARKFGLSPETVEQCEGGFFIRRPEPLKVIKTAGKTATLRALLVSGWTNGADLENQLGWLPHTVRGAISTLKASGLPIERRRVEGVTSYRIGPPA